MLHLHPSPPIKIAFVLYALDVQEAIEVKQGSNLEYMKSNYVFIEKSITCED
jgi:hypothetical protein